MTLLSRVEVVGPDLDESDRILSPAAVAFILALDNQFAGRRCEVLAERRERAALTAAGWDPDFREDTAAIRDDPSWQVCAPAPGLLDRRVEITGPPERRMTVNALNSGAKVWLADFEDANAPTWPNLLQGQANLLDAVSGTLNFDVGAKHYEVGPNPATIVVRPRGWHLVEKNLLIDGRPVSASILDFGLYLFHCAQRQIENGSGPYFYLPKLEGHLEARLWNDVFAFAQDWLGIARGTIRATVLIETIWAAFEMDEILYELRDHCAGLNAGRWDYLFSIIKGFSGRGSEYVLPDRSALTMTTPMMRAYTTLLVDTCHRRGAHAIGGMSAFIPSPDPFANVQALAQVRLDKQREADDGFDGSWVAHPGLVATCRDVFDAVLGGRPHQVRTPLQRAVVTRQDLLAVGKTPGQVTLAGVQANIAVGLRYIRAWLGGSGAVAINGLMEDVATAEIARSQIWQWLHNSTPLAEGGEVQRDLVLRLVEVEMASMATEAADARMSDTRAVFCAIAVEPDPPLFLTSWAYPRYLVADRVSGG